MVTDAGDKLEHRAENGDREPLGRGGRHHLALGAGHHTGDAANVGEERERIDRLRVERAPIPAESPPLSDRLDRTPGEELELLGRKGHRPQSPRESVDQNTPRNGASTSCINDVRFECA